MAELEDENQEGLEESGQPEEGLDLPELIEPETTGEPSRIAGQDSVGQKLFNSGRRAFDNIKGKPSGKPDSSEKTTETDKPNGKDDKNSVAKKANDAKDIARGIEGGARMLSGEGLIDPTAWADLLAGLKAAKDEFWPMLKKYLKICAAAIIVMFAAIFFVIGMSFLPATEDSASANTVGNCAIFDIGSPNSDGYYQLPDLSYYTLNANGGSPRSAQWGNKDTIELIVNVGKTWSTNHSDQLFSVGDINSSGHDSHTTGVDFDIYADNSLFMDRPGGGVNASYDKALTIELAKTFLETGAIEVIGYSDQSVVDTINKDYPGKMDNWSGHKDHFHVSVKKGAYTCKEEGNDPSSPGKKISTGLPLESNKGFRITSDYGMRICPIHGKEFHPGVDLSNGKSGNAPVFSVGDGKITSLTYSSCALQKITIQHDSDFKTRYLHLKEGSNGDLKVGSTISKGQQIGVLAPSGSGDTCSTGPHLHFETYVNGKTQNPGNIIDLNKL